MSAQHHPNLSADNSSGQTDSVREKPAQPQGPPTFPDGGYQAYATAVGGFLMLLATFGYTNSFGVYQDYYVRIRLANYSSSNISWIGSIQLLFLLSIGLPIGRAFDRGYFYHLIISGSIIYIVCLFLLSLTKPQSYYQVFLSQGLGMGLGMGMIYLPTMGVIAHHFQKKRVVVMGFVVAGASIGGVIHPIMLNKLFHGSVGFEKGVRASAGLNLGLVVISILLMRTRLPPRNTGGLGPAVKKFARDLPYLFAVFGSFLVVTGIFFPVFFLQLYSVTQGVNSNISFYTLAILNALNAIGRFVPSYVAQKVGVYQTLVPSTLLSGVLTFVLLAAHNTGGVVAVGALYGFFSGVYISMLVPMIAMLADGVSEIGIRMGVCFTFTGLGAFVGTPIAGALLGSNFTWWRPVTFAGVLIIVGTFLISISGVLLSRKRAKQARQTGFA